MNTVVVRADQPETVLLLHGDDNATNKKPLGVFFWICVGWVSLVILLAIIANLLPLPNPDFQNFATQQNAGPGWGHLLGTDDLNRDILSRLIFGSGCRSSSASGA
jgi:ABC-type dipeptide/oligopeptide/nickel transport system permease subunit